MSITPIAAFFAFLGVAGIAANRHWTGHTEWINLGWTAVAAVGALGFAGIVAQGAFRTFKINGLANFIFVLVMSLTSAGVVLYKGPAHDFAVTRLSTTWPAGAELLAKTDSTGPAATKPAPAMNSKTVKGEPAIRVYRKSDQSAGVQPKSD